MSRECCSCEKHKNDGKLITVMYMEIRRLTYLLNSLMNNMETSGLEGNYTNNIKSEKTFLQQHLYNKINNININTNMSDGETSEYLFKSLQSYINEADKQSPSHHYKNHQINDGPILPYISDGDTTDDLPMLPVSEMSREPESDTQSIRL